MGHILAFLSSGMEMSLALSTINGQISALAVLFQRLMMSQSLVVAFVKGFTWIIPPVWPPCFNEILI